MSEDEESVFQEQILGLATAVTPQTYQNAKTAYEDARTNGLCHAGAWECALATIGAVENQASTANNMV